MSRSFNDLAACCLLSAAAVLAGCAAPADKQAMTVQRPAAAGKQHPYSVGVETSGGAATGALDSSNIGNDDLKAAIESSIRQTKVFREVVQGRTGQYELSVNVISLSKPTFGLSFTVDLECGWTLTRLGDGQVVWRKAIRSSHTASMGDAFAGVVRLRLAVEGAARANIAQGLDAIGQLSL